MAYWKNDQQITTPAGSTPAEPQKEGKIMKKALLGFLAGMALTAAVFVTYAHFNMVNMPQVVDIQTTDSGAMIVTVDGSGYYWER